MGWIVKIKSGLLFNVFLALVLCSKLWAATVQLQPIGDVTTWPDTPFRWMDIADFLYSADYQGNFTYDQPSVTVTYCNTSNSFSGMLTATGLKPNFAYQVKLVGKPQKVWGEDGDDWTNEQIGYAGRWWRKQPNPGNTNDADYDAHKDDADYIFEGYLLFDFFVTDQQGSATLKFYADSSFHVLWATHDSTGDGTGHRDPGPNDSEVRYTDFTAAPTTHPDAYDFDYGAAHVGIYAEWQSDRDLPGEIVPAPGNYNCRFILTEESFHQSGSGGGWASVMGYDDINFTLVAFDESDIDRDGSVDGSDLAGFADAYARRDPEADLNQDGFVNASDVALFAGQFGNNTCRAGI
jgi:hypothetical protein